MQGPVFVPLGERYDPGPVLERLDELARHGMNGTTTIKVPTFDYAATSKD